MKIEVTQADMECARNIRNAWDVSCDTAFEIAAKHRILATRTDATPSHWSYSDGETEFIVNKRQNPKHYPYCTETPLYPHPPATDVAALVEAAKAMLPTDPRLAGKLPDDAIAPLNVWGSELNALRQAIAPFTKGQNDV